MEDTQNRPYQSPVWKQQLRYTLGIVGIVFVLIGVFVPGFTLEARFGLVFSAAGLLTPAGFNALTEYYWDVKNRDIIYPSFWKEVYGLTVFIVALGMISAGILSILSDRHPHEETPPGRVVSQKIDSSVFDSPLNLRLIYGQTYVSESGVKVTVARAADPECVTLKIFNGSEKKIAFSSYDFELKDQQGNKFVRDDSRTTVSESSIVPVNRSTSGTLCWDTNRYTDPVHVVLKSGNGSDPISWYSQI